MCFEDQTWNFYQFLTIFSFQKGSGIRQFHLKVFNAIPLISTYLISDIRMSEIKNVG